MSDKKVHSEGAMLKVLNTCLVACSQAAGKVLLKLALQHLAE